MTDLQTLKQRVERASGGDRELDCRIAYALGMNWCNPKWSNSLHDWRQHIETHGFEAAWTSDHVYRNGYDAPPTEDYGGSLVPNYTTSIDAALALVERLLPGWSWRIGNRPGGGAWVLLGTSRQEHLGATPALALLSALLAALSSKAGETE